MGVLRVVGKEVRYFRLLKYLGAKAHEKLQNLATVIPEKVLILRNFRK